jgi:hypothetical protein
MNKTKLICLSILFIFLGCGKNDPDDSSYKNSEYIWFISDSSEEGEWIKLDKDNDGEYLKNGSYEMYYSNGTIYEKGHFNELGDYDTAWYYDTSSTITHYTVNENDDYYTRMLKDGIFSTFSTKGELTVTGEYINGEFSKMEMQGPLRTPAQLMCIYLGAKDIVDHNAKEIKRVLKDIINQESPTGSFYLTELDSTNVSNRKLLAMKKIRLSLVESNKITKTLKKSVQEYTSMWLSNMDNELPQIFLLSKDGITEKERVQANEILNKLSKESSRVNQQIKESMNSVFEPYKYQDYLYDFLDLTFTDCR